MPGDGIDRFGVPRRFLAHVEPDQRQTEGDDAAQHIGQPAVGDESLPTGAASVAEAQRLGELFASLVSGIGVRAPAGAASVSSASTTLTRGFDAPLQFTQHRAIRLVRALGAGQQLGARAGHRQLEAEHLDLARVQRQRRPARHQRTRAS